MLNNNFILRSENSNITIKGGFLKRILNSTYKSSFSKEKEPINFFMEESTKLDVFEIKLLKEIKKRSYYSYLLLQFKNRKGSVLTFIISLIIITLIALLSIHGSMTYDLFSGSKSSNIFELDGVYLYLIISLIILLFLILSPKLILGEYNSLFDWANSRFSTNERIIRRLARELNLLHKVYRQDKILNVWNPLVAGADTWICNQLIPALSMMSFQVNILIKSDEKDTLLKTMKKNGLDDLYTSQTIEDDNKAKISFPFKLLSTWEKECMHCLLFSSNINLPEEWKENGTKLDVSISIELSERVYNIYAPKLSSKGSGHTTFEKFMNRCVVDYNYMSQNTDKRVQNFILLNTSLIKEIDYSLMEAIRDTVKNNISSASTEIKDPLALVILMGLIGLDHALDTKKIDLVSAFIRNVKRLENYQLIRNYWKYISKEENSTTRKFKLGLLQFMDVQTLSELSVCFVNSGMYTNANEVFGILENIHPAKIAIEKADLKDSLGEYKEALQIILKANKDWVESGILEDKALILQIYHLISWVIVSGRFIDYKEKGYQYLAKTESILRKLPSTESYLLYLTRHFNTMANYNEWEENFELAIENYEKALKLPGNILRKSSLLSNRGTAERFLGNKTNDMVARRKHFLESKSNIQQAVDMKKGIGEKNQLPGTTQNLAETLLELARITEEKEKQIKILIDADRITSEGLDILDEMQSEKRRGRLLAKKYIAHHMLAEIGEKSEEVLIRKVLNEWMKKEDKESFDYREVMRLFNHFGID